MFVDLFSNNLSWNDLKAPTVDDEPGLAGVGGAKVVGDDALVTTFVCKGDLSQVQDCGVLRYASSSNCRVGPVASMVCLYVGVVFSICVLK